MTHAMQALLVAAILVGVGGLEAVASPTIYYSVTQVEGVVLTRSANGTRWQPVRKSMRLNEGRLIQVTSGASVSLEERSHRKAGGMRRDRVQLTLSRPIVARLSSDLLREVKLSTFFVDGSKATSKMAVDIPMPDVPLTWNDAWERLAAMVTRIPPPDKPAAELAQLEQQGISLAVSARKLRIVAPTPNTVVQTRDWPAELKVVWIKPNGGPKKFSVYAWKAGAPRGSAQAHTKSDYHTVKISQPGTFFVQVMSTDGAWQSAAHAVYAVTPLEQSIAGLANQSKVSRVDAAKISLQYPPDNFVSTAGKAIQKINFMWNSDAALSDRDMVLKVTNQAGHPIHEVTAKVGQIELPLPPGRYAWSVAAAGGDIRSLEQQFEVVAPSVTATSASRRQLLRRVIGGGQDAVVYFDSGI